MSACIVRGDDPRYLKAAFSVLGLSEIEGEGHERQILAMYAACGHPEIDRDEVAWCAAYVGWCLHRGGLANTGSLLAISYASYPGRKLTRDEPVPRGAICVWPRTGGNHVNFALADLGDAILCIGGNQANGKGGGVTIAKFQKRLLKVAVLPNARNTAAAPPQKPMPPLEAPKPVTEKKTGLSEGAKLGTGIGVLGVLSEVFAAIRDAPQQLLEVVFRAAEKPQFWLFAAVVAIGAFLWWRRNAMKKEA